MDAKSTTGLIVAGIGGLFVLFLVFGGFFTVQPYEQAILTRWGDLRGVYSQGFHLKMPFADSVEKFPTEIQQLSPEKPVNTYTVDNQEVDVRFTVFYRIPVANVASVYVNNRDYSPRLFAMTIDRLKVAMGQVNVQSVAEKRGELRDAIKVTLAHDAASLGLEVTDVQLTDLQYTDQFRGAVNNAAVQKANIESIEYQRQQSIKTAEMVKIAAEGNANATREKARGDADAVLLAATAEAKAVQLKGEAQAKAIDAQGKALAQNLNLVELRRVEHWDGKLPVNVYGSAPIPFMPIGGGK